MKSRGEKLFRRVSSRKAVQDGKISQAELDEHVHRILRTEFMTGLVDDPIRKSVVDVAGGMDTALRIEEHSIVLLKNAGNLLPLDKNALKSIAIIGDHADVGMISRWRLRASRSLRRRRTGVAGSHVWFPTSPLKSVIAKAPTAKVLFDSGKDTASAAALAAKSDVAIVFVQQWTSEGEDLKSLSLPDNQDAIIRKPWLRPIQRRSSVLENSARPSRALPQAGNIDKVGAVAEAWYAGSNGSNAVANVLFGDVNPSAKLPMTFPKSEADLPHPTVVQPPPHSEGASPVMRKESAHASFSVTYDEGLKVGYKWYDAEKKPVLFPFGFGLSYTTFAYKDLQVTPGSSTSVTFTVIQSPATAQAPRLRRSMRTSLPASTEEPPKRLVGWTRVKLAPGESKTLSVAVEPKVSARFWDEAAAGWKLVPGSYTFMVGGSSQDLPLTKAVSDELIQDCLHVGTMCRRSGISGCAPGFLTRPREILPSFHTLVPRVAPASEWR